MEVRTHLSWGLSPSLTCSHPVDPEPRNPSRWTFFAICGVNDNGRNANCGASVPALPFDPPRNFGTDVGLPDAFMGLVVRYKTGSTELWLTLAVSRRTHRYYYLSRFMFAFYLIALFFAVISLFTSLLALCTRFGAYLSGLNTVLAMFFQALAAALMT